MIGYGDIKIEYYTADGKVITTEPAVSVGAAKQKADENCTKPGIAASSWAVMKCVLSSMDS
ncbi:MAG: hypothetical protein ACXV8Q_03350 [Methylobacter sp.]